MSATSDIFGQAVNPQQSPVQTPGFTYGTGGTVTGYQGPTTGSTAIHQNLAAPASPAATMDWGKLLAGLGSLPTQQKPSMPMLPAANNQAGTADMGLVGAYSRSLADQIPGPQSQMGLLSMPRFNLRR